MKTVCVAAARPNFMKVKPVLDALERAGHDTVLVHTGQHYDPVMSDVFFDELGIREPDHHLGVGSGSHGDQTARVLVEFESLLEDLASGSGPAELTLVVGDVNSTLACSLASAKAGIPVAHVEAGLRSRDWSMPEEVNRVVTDRLSDVLFAPSIDAADNLHREGYRCDQIHLVGNVMIDTLYANLDRARGRGVAAGLGLDGPYGVVTMHRPANVDDPAALRELVDALERIAVDIALVLPAHPRSAAALTALAPRRVHVVEPFGYLDFLGLLCDATLVLTDSGGIQEETTALGVPCLTMRDTTERPITVTNGTNRVVGVRGDDIVAAARETLCSPPPARCPDLWDGHAADRIAAVLTAGLPAKRPTELS